MMRFTDRVPYHGLVGWDTQQRSRGVDRRLSSTYRVLGGDGFLKVYRRIEHRGRRGREIDALKTAAEWGLPVPDVIDAGDWGEESWVLLSTVRGAPHELTCRRDVHAHLRRVRSVADEVHHPAPDSRPGRGWRSDAAARSGQTNRDHLLDRLSRRCSELAWWTPLRDSLRSVDAVPVVYLHGDLKTEHLLINGNRTYVVDWEDCGRGPAVCDYTDVVFHLVRDLIYTDRHVDGLVAADIAQELPVPGSVLGWRVAMWLDRRRPADIFSLTPLHIQQLVEAPTPHDAVTILANTIEVFRARRVPR